MNTIKKQSNSSTSTALAKAPTIEVDCVIEFSKARVDLPASVHLLDKNGIVQCDCYLWPASVMMFEKLKIGDKFAESLCEKSQAVYERMKG